MRTNSPTHLQLKFVDDDVSAVARLRWDVAPDICRSIVDASPFVVRAHHAIFSGSEIAAITPQLPRLPLANPTSAVAAGDLAFTFLRAEDHDDVDEDFTEICWFYRPDGTPSMASGPVKVEVFAHFERPEAFFDVCFRMRLEGAKMIEVSCADQ